MRKIVGTIGKSNAVSRYCTENGETMNEMNVIWAADDHYAVLAGVSMLSLLENHKHCKNLNVYILSDHISEKNKERLQKICEGYQRVLSVIEVADALKGLKDRGVNGYANASDKGYTTYARLMIPDLIPDVKRVVYLDCDTLVVGDISALFQFDMENKAIGFALDCSHNKYKNYIKLDEEKPYYNAGVTVMDVQAWKKNCMERILSHIANVRAEYPLVDQDLMNVVLQEDICLLSAKYNFLSQYYLYSYSDIQKVYGLKEEYFYSEREFPKPNEAAILHFCGQTFIRPWYRNSKHPAKKRYDWYYRKSPWGKKAQEKCRWKPEYRIQYLLWRYTPRFINTFCGKIMQRIFIWMNYKV